MIYIFYLILAILVVFLSVRLSYYVDFLDKKTNLSGAFIGGIMLAAVTSLPELFSSLTAIINLDQPNLIQGNVLGSNMLNLCILATLLLFTCKQYKKATMSKFHRYTIMYGLLMYIIVLFAIINPMIINVGILKFNFATILIPLVYLINIKIMDNSGVTDEIDENIKIDLTIKQIIVRFILYSIALIIVSVILTQVTDKIADRLNLGVTLAGAVFLGVATSLPELSSAITLVKIGNFDASFGNIIGSNLFNFIVICFSDVIYLKGSIYNYDQEVIYLLGFGIFSMLCALGLAFFKRKPHLIKIFSILILVAYITSIALSI